MPRSFFSRNTLTVCEELIGMRLVRILPNGRRLAGFITEVEAYRGEEDLACHAQSGKTSRNRSMWGPPGKSYMFFIYGMHWMFNIVTETDGFPAAILIRGLLPSEGIREMQLQRSGKPFQSLTNGPAKLCQALDLNGSWDGYDLTADRSQLFLEKSALNLRPFATTSPRVGLNNVPEPWKSIPWRYRISPQEILHLTEGGFQG